MTVFKGKSSWEQGLKEGRHEVRQSLKRLAARFGMAVILINTGAAFARPGALPTHNATGKARIAFEIPAQPLQSAVTVFGFQSGYQIAVDQATLTGLKGNQVRGSFTPPYALGRLLAGTGVNYRLIDENSVTLAAAETQKIRPVQVEGQPETA